MQLRDNGLGFSPITIALHWAAAALLIALLLLQLQLFAQAGDAAALAGPRRLRNTLALLLFVLSCYRLWARLSSFHPLPVGTPNPVQLLVGRAVAVALTLACMLLPIAAWLSMAAGGETVELLGGGGLPAPLAPDAGLRRLFDALFLIGLAPFLAGLALHVFAAARNHLVLGNDTLRRMLGKRVEL